MLLNELFGESDDEDLVFIKNEPGFFNTTTQDSYNTQNVNPANTSSQLHQQQSPYTDSGGQQWPPQSPYDPSTTANNSMQLNQANIDSAIAQVGIFLSYSYSFVLNSSKE